MKPNADRPTEREIEAAAAKWVGRRDAGLTPAGEEEFKRWREADPSHEEALRNLDGTWSVLAKPLRCGDRAGLELELAKLAGRRKRRRATVRAAAFAVMVGIGLATWNLYSHRPDAPNAIVRLPPRQTLPDGSIVELRGEARIVVDYTANARRVTLKRGEAHFAVEKNADRPFIVSAGNVDVRAVGTAFSVQLGSTAVEVLVTDGRVAVDKPLRASEPPRLANADAAATVDAGKRVVFEMAAATPKVSVVSADEVRDRLGWRSTRLDFTRTTLTEAVALLNQHAPASTPRLVVADAALATMRVNGVFRADNSEAFVVLLENAFGVEAERLPDTIKLRKAPVPKSE